MKMRATISLLILPLVAALGCQQGEEQAEGEQAAQMEAAAEGEMAGGSMRSLEMASLNESGITGTAELSHTADQMTVTLNMEGLTAGESYPAHIHKGSCEQGGPPVVTLTALQPEAGSASSTTQVAMSKLMVEKADEAMKGDMAESEMAEGEMAEGEMMDAEMAEGEMAEGEMMDGEMMDGEMMDQKAGYYIQVHNPDGSPAACVDIEAGEQTHPME